MTTEHSLWGNLPLLVRANSKESVEYILQALWRTRKVGLDSADRDVIRDLLQLQNDTLLDPLLVCLRMLIRKCVCENPNKDEIQKLFPDEVSPEIQRLLALLLQKFHNEWREDISKDEIQNKSKPGSGETDVNFQVSKDKLETMLKSMRDQPSKT
ncbi:hypothetical protein SSX86_013730 [Deinandra increscens subsp. villosa]|uniref:COMM domain-containing protein n=1 Tax=Deinandra increscens subsp. villosa TaxID=3103831 RepID=A0AAP0D4P8_9ASTR